MWIKFTEFSVELSDLGEEHRNNLTTCKTKCKTRNTLHVHTLHWLTLTGYTVCSLHSNFLVTWVSIIILLTNNDITCNANDKMIKLTLQIITHYLRISVQLDKRTIAILQVIKRMSCMEAGSGVRSMDKKASIATNMSRTPVLIQRHLKGFKHVQTIRYENSIYGKAKKNKNRRLFFRPFVLSILFNTSNKYFTDVNCYIFMWQQIFGYVWFGR